MLQLDRDFPRPKSDIKRRTSLVIWLTVGFSLISLIFAYAFYMRYRDEEDQQIPWRDREADCGAPSFERICVYANMCNRSR